MTTPAHPAPTFPSPNLVPTGPGPLAFGWPFWFTYGANASMMTAVSLLFRYNDFVRSVGGDEFQLGLIVSAGMIASLLLRVGLGSAIDGYGARRVWVWSAATVVACCWGHLAIDSADSSLLFALRICMQTGIAGFFGASISYVSGRAPLAHVVEVVGTLGTSGFIGTVCGTVLGDQLLGAQGNPRRMFIAAGSIGCGALVFGLLATGGEQRPRRDRRRPPLGWLLRRYHPGPMLIMGAVAGFGLSIPTIYLRPYSVERGIAGIAWYFFPYMAIAFTTRLLIRRMPARYGIRPMVLIGGFCAAVGLVSLNVVRVGWHYLLPAFWMGISHAIMFPSVVAGGSTAFPARYRGLGTTVMLATFDLGGFIASLSVGTLVVQMRWLGWPAYPTTFTCVATAILATTALYAWMSRPRLGRNINRDEARQITGQTPAVGPRPVN